MHYSKIIPFDVANGPGFRVSLFVSGCRNQCPGCFNKEAWDFEYGTRFTWETVHEIEKLLANPNVRGLSILGGDPFEPENRLEVIALCGYVRHKCPDKDIWMWTGCLWEDVNDLPIMNHIDVLVDGPFEEDKKDLKLAYSGSWNQRTIDVKKSLDTGEVVLWGNEE